MDLQAKWVEAKRFDYNLIFYGTFHAKRWLLIALRVFLKTSKKNNVVFMG